MVSRNGDRKITRITCHIVQASAITLLCAFAFATAGFAQSLDTGWKTETRLYLSGMSTYWEKNHASATYDTLATAAELRFKSEARPWHASLFAEYRFSTDRRFTDQFNLGGLFKYGWHNWDATTYLFVNKSRRTQDTWHYAGRVRYRVADNHKLGIEAIASFRYPQSPTLTLGYYGTVSDSFSVNVFASPGIGDGPDFAARLEMIWRIH